MAPRWFLDCFRNLFSVRHCDVEYSISDEDGPRRPDLVHCPFWNQIAMLHVCKIIVQRWAARKVQRTWIVTLWSCISRWVIMSGHFCETKTSSHFLNRFRLRHHYQEGSWKRRWDAFMNQWGAGTYTDVAKSYVPQNRRRKCSQYSKNRRNRNIRCKDAGTEKQRAAIQSFGYVNLIWQAWNGSYQTPAAYSASSSPAAE